MVKLLRCELEAISSIAEAQIGSNLMIVFSSSTLWTVASRHRFNGSFMSDSDTIAARSRHLHAAAVHVSTIEMLV